MVGPTALGGTWVGKVAIMDQSVKIAAASSVLLGGIILALLFRHESPRPGPSVPATGDRLLLRKCMEPPLADRAATARHHGRGDPSDAAPQPAAETATILTPMGAGQPPPDLARAYPHGGAAGTSRWGISIGLSLPDATPLEESLLRHKIVDGDTLSALAGRYLGSADRYLEIYEANRDVLPSPEILPIGAELRIPLHRIRAAPPSEVTRSRPLAPIPRGGEVLKPGL